jgi:hypothetical protein
MNAQSSREPSRVCVYYSAGPHFHAALQAMRSKFPDAHLVGIIPPDYPVSQASRDVADDFITTERERYSLRMPRACIQLARLIRAGRYDVFAVMFRSGQLEALSALSGASTRYSISPRAKIIPLQATLPTVVLSTVMRRLRGRLTYALVWVLVRALRVNTRPNSRAR